MLSRAAFSIFLLSLFSTSATAQRLKSYFGPTLGISTPFLWRPYAQNYVIGHIGHKGRNASIPSPILGVNGGIMVGRHLALDAALQYSYTGGSYSVDFSPPHSAYVHEERLRIHKLVLPLTVGYAGETRRTHIRFGVGCALNYLVAGRATIDFTSAGANGALTPVRATINPFDETVAQYSGSRLQVLPRASFSATFAHRWMIGAAYNHGRSRPVYLPSIQGGLYSSVARNSAIELTVTYLIRTSQTAGKVQENISDK